MAPVQAAWAPPQHFPDSQPIPAQHWAAASHAPPAPPQAHLPPWQEPEQHWSGEVQLAAVPRQQRARLTGHKPLQHCAGSAHDSPASWQAAAHFWLVHGPEQQSAAVEHEPPAGWH